jgi:protein-tyrosine phosphatase
MIKVLFVCMGNICRSPTAHGVFDALIKKEGLDALIEVDSAGTHAYHVGELPDRRSQQTALRRGLDLDYQRARKVLLKDMEIFDYILAMDESNLQDLMRICPDEHQVKLSLLMSYAPHFGQLEVPDPYYGGDQGFDHVFDMVEEAAKGLLDDLRKRHQL